MNNSDSLPRFAIGPTPAAVLTIGNTPVMRLHRFAEAHGVPDSIQLLLKMEWTNPGGSIKDRPALAIVQAALESGQLAPGKTLIDSSSGNTGISYAMLGAAYGFPVEIVLPGSASEERKQILRAYGATVIESDALEGSDGAIRAVRLRVDENPDRYFFADQYSNENNWLAHFEGTGPEVWRQTAGQVTHFVAALGTTGTLVGTGRYLKRANPKIQLIAVQPADSFHGIEGLKHIPTAIVPPIYDDTVPDEQATCSTDRAYDLVRSLARVEGLFAGTSTGAALAAAVDLGCSIGETGSSAVIVIIAPDGGSKYLSTRLWSEADSDLTEPQETSHQ